MAEVARRHQDAVEDAIARGCSSIVAEFEDTAASSRAVIARPIEEALRLAKSDMEAYATYYDLLHAGVRLPEGKRWERLRGLADWELFGPARDKIRFAALSLDGTSLPTYGDVAMELADSMIAHRATVFDENSAVFFEKQRRNGHEPPRIAGHRARWSDRNKLAVAKHAHELTPTSTPSDFAMILLRAGSSGTGADDTFIEVHVCGSMTRRTISRMTVTNAHARPAFVIDLRDRLEDVGVIVEGA